MIKDAYSDDERAKLSSCADAPPKNPPPGFFAEAKFNKQVLNPDFSSRRASIVVVFLKTISVFSFSVSKESPSNSSGETVNVPSTDF
ncbi:hypothetical protein D3C71_1596100 [compost metagenome]